jgi:alpha-galactosidase
MYGRCLGGGSLYFRRALADLVLSEDLAGSEIALYDIDAEKVELMAAMGRRLAERAGTNFTVRASIDKADAVDGADFALSSIGGCGAEVTSNVYHSNYHNADIRIPAKYGICQVIGDTCGPAGMMMALRSIPPISSSVARWKSAAPLWCCSITLTRWRYSAVPCTNTPT